MRRFRDPRHDLVLRPRHAFLIVAALFLLLVPHASAAKNPALKLCRKSCNIAKSLCLTQAKAKLKAALGDCSGAAADQRQCRKQAKTTSHADRAACADFKRTCTACCTSSGTDCSARCGDGTVTPGRGEDCDPPGSACGVDATCGADCRCPAGLPGTTSTTVPPTTSTTTLATTTTTGAATTTTTTTEPGSTTTSTSITTTTTAASTTTTTGPTTTTTTSPGTTTTSTTTTSTTTTTTTLHVGLGLVMTAAPDPVGLNDVLTYELTVTNRDAIDAANVSVQLQIPNGIGSCQAFSDGGTAPSGCLVGRNAVWTIGTLHARASRTVQAVFTTSGSAATIPDGTIIHGTAAASDDFGDQALASADVTVQSTGPLQLAIAADHDPARVGDVLEYTVRFGNRGGTAQLSSSLVATLPAGMTATAASDGGMIAGNVVTWTLGTLNPGDSGERRVALTVGDGGSNDPLVTEATLTSAAASARASDATSLVDAVPLGLVIVATPDPVSPNEILTYELTVTNLQATDAAGVAVRMEIPTGVGSCQAFSDGGTAANGCLVGRDVVWTLGTLATGASRTVSAVFSISNGTADPNGTILRGTARAIDAATNGARAAVATPVTATGPLTVALSADHDPVRAGDDLEYTLRFGNRGGVAQLNSTLTVTLPAGTTATATTGGAAIAGSTVTWTLGTLNPGDVGERRVTVSVDDGGVNDPLVRVTRATIAGSSASARASEVTSVVPAVPLGLVMTATPDPVSPNEIITYEITVTNLQDADTAGVELRMEIPTGMGSCQAFSDGGTAASGCLVGRDVVWTLGTLSAGASRTVTAAFASATTLPNGAVLRGAARAEDAAGNGARAAVASAVTATGPLMLAIADDADPVRVGDVVEYTIRYGNRGGAAQLNASLVVTLPAGLSATAASDGGAIVGHVVTWTLGTLNAGDTGEQRVTVAVEDIGALDPLVRLVRGSIASGSVSATAGQVTTIAAEIPLGLVMIATPDPVSPNEIVTYELSVTNRQGFDAAGVEVRMQIPTGVGSCQAFSDAGTAPSGCLLGRDVVWSLGTIPAGGSRTVSAAFASTTPLPNGTVVRAASRAQDAGGDAARAAVASVVTASGSLVLGIADDADPVRVGDAVQYTLRYGNRGATAQLGATLVVTLPDGVTPTATTAGGVVSGNTVTWTLGTLNAGDTGDRRVTVTVDDLSVVDPLVRRVRGVIASTTASARATEVTTVAPTIGLDLAIAATPDPVGRNAILTYQLMVTNAGAVDVADVQLRMQIPTGVASCQSFSDGGTAASGCLLGRDVTWSLGTLAHGASHTVSAAFATVSTATLTNGTIIHATSRVQDAGGDTARADTSTAVFQ
jgi:uncharacterized repeat protein (TIGR01451 family)